MKCEMHYLPIRLFPDDSLVPLTIGQETGVNLFVYGTLMHREQIEFLLNHTLDDPVEAIMVGFTTVISEWGYRVMVPSENARVKGIVWKELTAQDFVILDRYEGCNVEVPVYQREKRQVMIHNRQEEAWGYFGTPNFFERIHNAKNTRKL